MNDPAPQFTVSPPDVLLEGVGVERKHTPGPWRICTTPCELYQEWCISPVADSGIIATARYFRGRRAKANAILIAAAPDMLDALVEIVNKYGDGWGGQIAAKAIAKATTPPGVTP